MMVIKIFMFAYLFVFINTSCADEAAKQVHDNANFESGDRRAENVGIEKIKGYDFDKPDDKWELPKSLKEISGITWLSNNKLLAIEDIHPILYELELKGKKADILNKIEFKHTDKDKFDFEDLVVKGKTVYALWSHGVVFKINNWEKADKVEKTKTWLTKENNTEGMAYDPVTGNLLIACKNESGLDDEKKSARVVYEFDTKGDSINSKPFLVINKKDFEKTAGEKVDFYPSAIAVHPITHDIYIISTRTTKCIAQFNYKGKMMAFSYLDKDLLIQPEGICFDPEGTMFISTEGKKGEPPYICQFNMKK